MRCNLRVLCSVLLCVGACYAQGVGYLGFKVPLVENNGTYLVYLTVESTSVPLLLDTSSSQLTMFSCDEASMKYTYCVNAPRKNSSTDLFRTLYRDGEKVNLVGFNDSMAVEISLSSGVPNCSDATVGTSQNFTTFVVSNKNRPGFLEGVNGMLGLGSCPSDRLASSFSNLINVTDVKVNCAGHVTDLLVPHRVGLQFLDFNSTGAIMEIGYSERRVQWADRRIEGDDGRSFELFRLSLCGANILGNYSNHWRAVVDTTSRCLSLPSFLLNHVLARLPVSCDDGLCALWSESEKDFRVPFSLNIQDSYPFLRFKVSDISPVWISVSIESLAMDERHLCLLDSGPDGEIVFGTQVLRSLYFAHDFEEKLVGFASNLDWMADNSTFCLESPECGEWEEYYEAGNVCIPSDCSPFLFRSWTSEKTCAYTFWGKFLIGSVVLFMCLMEIGLFEVRRWLLIRVERSRHVVVHSHVD